VLKIVKTEADGHTGHLSVHCHIVEKDGNSTMNGSLETHGVHPDKLQEMFGGDVKLWLKGIHKEMKQRHESCKRAAVALKQLKDVTYIEDEEN
jgi:hypothetical protein